MKEYLLSVEEALNTPIQVDWIKTNYAWRGTFAIEKNIHEILILNFSKHGHWLFSFKCNDTYKLINDPRKVWSVIPTIDNAALDFVEETKPAVLFFSAKDDSTGRKKFYTKFCQDIENKFNYNFQSIKGTNNSNFYVLYSPIKHDNYEIEQTEDKIMNFIKNGYVYDEKYAQ